MKLSEKSRISPQGLFFSVFVFSCAGFLLFPARSAADTASVFITQLIIFGVVSIGTDRESETTGAFFAGTVGKPFSVWLCGLFSLTALIVAFADADALAADVWENGGVGKKAALLVLLILAICMTSRGLCPLSWLCEASALLLIGALIAFLFASFENGISTFSPFSALRAVGGAGVFFCLASHCVTASDRQAGGALQARGYRPKNRRLFILAVMVGGALCAAVFSYIMLHMQAKGSGAVFFILFKWCVSLLRLCLSVWATADFSLGEKSPPARAVLLALLWLCFTVLALYRSENLLFENGLIAAVCLNLIPMLLFSVGSLFRIQFRQEQKRGNRIR